MKIDEMFCGAIAWLKTNNTTYGVGGGKYGTTLPVTRQAMASFLHRLQDLPQNGPGIIIPTPPSLCRVPNPSAFEPTNGNIGRNKRDDQQ